MTNFTPPPMDRKKKDKDEEGGEDDVSLCRDVRAVTDPLCSPADRFRPASADKLQRHLWPRVLSGDQTLHGADQREGDVLRAGGGSPQVHRDAAGGRRRPCLPAWLEPHLLHAETPGDQPALRYDGRSRDSAANVGRMPHKLFSVFPGSNRYRILPLHSQIPREEQRRVFEPVFDNVTKVFQNKTLLILRETQQQDVVWVSLTS